MAIPKGVTLRAMDNVDETRTWVRNSIKDAFNNKQYIGRKKTLVLENPRIKEKEFSLKEQKDALLKNKNLSEEVRVDAKLIDNETGSVISEKKNFLAARSPYLTGRGSFISNGVYYTSANQFRLRPGAYTRVKGNGEVETHFNLESGTGSSSRINLDPKDGVFSFNLGTSSVKLYPLLKAMGASDGQLKDLWGEEIHANNAKFDNPETVSKLYTKLVPFGDSNDKSEQVSEIVKTLEAAKMESSVNKVTLGKDYSNVSFDAMLDSTKKILDVSRGSAPPDDRDSLQFKKIYGVEDFFSEKVKKDAGDLGKNIMRRLDREVTLDKLPSNYFGRQLWGSIKGDPIVSPRGTLAQPIEEINPLDLYDQQHKVTVMGEGGIGDVNVVTMEARNVHPSQFGFVDYIRTSESQNVGVDQRLAYGVRKGSDNMIYRKFRNVKTRKEDWLNPLEALSKKIAFPGAIDRGATHIQDPDYPDLFIKTPKGEKSTHVAALNQGEQTYVPTKDIEYTLDHNSDTFSTYNNLVPLPESIQGNRMILAGKAIAATVPLKKGEAPLLRSKNPHTGNSWDYDLGRKIMAKESRKSGRVTSIDKDNIHIDGERHGIYNNFPLNLKTYISNTPVVKVGDKVRKGQLIATSNYTDEKGVLSNGVNLKSAYLPYKGHNFEDGIVISEKAANKLASEQMYTYEFEILDPKNQVVDKTKFVAVFGSKYRADQLSKVSSNGVVSSGSTVTYGDPLIVAMQKNSVSSKDIEMGNLHRSLKNIYRDVSIEYNHHSDAEVTDVTITGKTIKVLVKTFSPAQVGDKLTGRFGNKGVISLIVPDSKMPRRKIDGENADILLNPLGIPSRINPAQMHEVLLSKISRKTGKPYIIESFKNTRHYDTIKEEAKKHGVSPEEDFYDPVEDREIKNVLNGESYIWKISKMSEGEIKGREIGSYSSDQQPIKGKGEGAKALKIGMMEVNALVGHGATKTLKEMTTIKGQKNDDFWRALRFGAPLPSPKTPFVYDKFQAMLQGAGVNVKKEGGKVQLLPLTNSDILRKSSGEIKRPELLQTKNMMPIREGLFDPAVTGGTIGTKWSHIKLTDAVPNPVMEEPIKNILELNQRKYIDSVRKNTLGKELRGINLDKEIERAESEINGTSQTLKNKAIKRLGYLANLKRQKLQPKDLMLNYVPVVPPVFRPVSVVGTSESVSPGDANLLYKDLMVANDGLKMLKGDIPDEDLENERLNLYRAAKAAVGLGDPINVKNKNKGVKGFIKEIVGDQPKTGFFQAKMLTKTQDLVGRGVAIPDPALGLDEVGLPKEIAWNIYKPFVNRRMVRRGIPALKVRQEIKEQSPRAMENLVQEMNERPVLINRNPSLHKYNIMAFKPRLRTDNVVAASPMTVSGFNLDFDGDMINVHIPVKDEAVQEAKSLLMPSKNLLHIKNRGVHYLPAQGSIVGLHALTSKKPTGSVKKFKDVRELREAFSRGLLQPTQRVRVG